MRKINSDFELLSEHIAFKNKTIIDVGCGTGDIVRWVAKQGAFVTGIDLEDMVKKAKSYKKDADEKYISGKGEELPFGDNIADFIIYIASFHHIPEKFLMQALKECSRVLKKTGKALLIEPIAEKDSYYEIIKLAEDEAEIQRKAYSVLKQSDIAGLRFVKEEKFYLERTFSDYKNLIQNYVEPETKRVSILEKAKKITKQFSKQAGIRFEDYTFKSIARLLILENNKQ